MRKMIMFLVVFFGVDRYMNYKLNTYNKKSRLMASSVDPLSKYVLLSEKKERTSGQHKKIVVAHNKKSNYFKWNPFSYSSNRNV